MTHPATLIKNSCKTYLRDWRAWLMLILPLAALGAVFVLADWLGAGRLAQAIDGSRLNFWSLAAITLASVAAIVFVGRCFSTAAIFASYGAFGGIKPKLKESYRVGLKTFWRLLGVSVLRGLIVFGGLLLLIVPGVIWATQYSLATQVAVIEGKGGLEALRRSKELTSGRLFETFVNLGVIGLVIGYGTWLASAALLIVIVVLSGLISFLVPDSAYAAASAVVASIALIAEAAVIWFALPLSPLAMMALYKDYSGK